MLRYAVLCCAGERFPMDKVVEAVEQASAPGRGGKVLLEG
jgi:hypothetical protein